MERAIFTIKKTLSVETFKANPMPGKKRLIPLAIITNVGTVSVGRSSMQYQQLNAILRTYVTLLFQATRL